MPPIIKTSVSILFFGLATALHASDFTATESGFWESVAWKGDAGEVVGALPNDAVARLGRHRTVTYRGIPADESVASMLLGISRAADGHARWIIESGNFTVTGDLIAGRTAAFNDAFVSVEGGTLRVGGDADFGRHFDGADGSLIVSGGAVEVAGALRLGAFHQSGAMLRFHNPGDSPAVKAASLVLGRAALDLTYDEGYEHVPGNVVTLIEYDTRDGQFGNFRDGDEFNKGRNRFRIDYDVPRDDHLSITLTALENWPSSPDAPNIIFVLVDDQGYADFPLNPHSKWASRYPMPEVEKLAAQGVNFTEAYVSGGVCHPSRVGILTGLYQQRLGVDNNLRGPSHNGMAVSQATVPDRLQGLGYKTYGIGKWHLGSTVEYHPNVRGFDYWNGMWSGSRSYYASNSEPQVFQKQMTPQFEAETGEYLTDRIGDLSVDFIDHHLANHPDDPFYMYVSYTAVHGPNDLRFLDPRFKRLEEEFGLTAKDYQETPIAYGGDRERTQTERFRLAGMTLALDENVGKMMDRLEAVGLAENTIVVYLNDNGGPGWVRRWGGNWSYNYPLRGHKGASMVEGSIRVPGVMAWPGVVPGGQTVSTPVISLDFMATFVQAAGAPDAVQDGLDGVDLLPMLRDGTELPGDRGLAWRADGVTRGGSALRMGDWKLLINDENQRAALFNLADDPGERNNLANQYPDILVDLKKRFMNWEYGTLAPFYGTATTETDEGLERHAIAGGYRLKQADESLAFLSAPFRAAYSMDEDVEFRFQARPTEVNHEPAAQLAYAFGDSADRGEWIYAIIDYGQSRIRLADGRSGNEVAADLDSISNDFTVAFVWYEVENNRLTFSHGGASVVLELDGQRTTLTHFAVGAAAMEGDLTTLVPTTTGAGE